jgi:hypothetical protein
MPFPATLEALEAAGYAFARSETCPACGEPVEVFSTPGKREISMNPMSALERQKSSFTASLTQTTRSSQ